MTLSITRRRAAAGVAVSALVAGGLLFAPTANAATVTDVRESQIAPTGEPFASGYHHEGAGTFQIVNAGLELTGDSAFVRGYTTNVVDETHPLSTSQNNVDDLNLLKASAFTSTGSTPVLKVSVFSTNITGAEPTVLSPVGAADGDWTSTLAIDAEGDGTDVEANTATPIDTIIKAIGTKYRVKGFGLFNESGTTTISTLTFADITYQFRNNAPVTADRTVSTKVNTALPIDLTATDVDGNALTFKDVAVVGGAVTGTAPNLTFTPARNFVGNAGVKYTVEDGRGGSATATTTISVKKQQGKVDIYRIHPTKPSVRSTVYVYASVTTDGQKAKAGSTVTVYAKSKKVGTAKVNSLGKVKVKLPNKLPAGNATLKVTQAGSSTLSGGTDSVKVKVRK
jgi:hypothetical protein